MCVGKGITGGYLPLAATFASQKIFDAFLGEPWEGKTFYHGHTYTGNPLACGGGDREPSLFEKNHLIESVQRKSVELGGMLDELRDDPHVGEIRQKGFMVGIDLVSDTARGTPSTQNDAWERSCACVCVRTASFSVPWATPSC